MNLRVELHAGWSAWRWFALRGAGFPFAVVAAAADRRGLRAVAADPRFREAMLWQNPDAYRHGVGWLLRQPAELDNRRTRKIEAAIASYLQRYAAKNDCIGFFGPLGWGTFAGEPAAAPGPGLIAHRTTYFEHWGIDALAARASRDRELLPYLAPRRHPAMRLDALPPEIAAIVGACDGTRTAREVARALAADEDETYAALAELRDRKLVIWCIEIPTHTGFPERALRAAVATAPEPVRRRVLAPLAELEAARDRVAAAAGDPGALDGALADLDRTFVRIADTPATRRPGETYAGRTLVYEDCRRDLELRIGPAFVRRLGPALALVLASARWYTHAVAARWTAHARRVHAALGGGAVDYLRFCEHAVPVDAGLVRDVVDELQRRWAAILQPAPGARRIALASAAIAPAVEGAFAAPRPGWPLARFHAPDLLVAARSAAAAVAGDATFVLGELHTGRSMLTTPIVLRESPHADALIEACREAVAVPRAAPVAAKAQVSRLDFGPVVACDYEIELGTTRSHLPRERVLAGADLVVVDGPTGLAVATRDGRLALDLVACFERHLVFATLARFSPVGPAAHVPRVAIDDLVIARERWQLAPGDVDLADLAGWAASRGIPRHVFVRIPEERKPVYIDLASPVLVPLLARLVRRASALTVTEMLPGPDELWLADRDGHRYTCELRITAVDPIAWEPG